MLVSKFNLKQKEETPEEHHEIPGEDAIASASADDAEQAAEEEALRLLLLEPTEVRVLKKSEISVNLSMLGKTADGDGYTYLQVTLRKLHLTDISIIKCFKHLQFVDVSENSLTTEALSVVTELPFLVLIHADFNQIRSAALGKAKYLQVMIMNNNKLPTISDVHYPELSTLEAGFNMISIIRFDFKMPTLKCLDLRNNMIQDLSTMEGFPNLDSLYLAFNKISCLIGIDTLVHLRVLHVRGNPIRFLTGITEQLVKLQYLNLRSCKVGTLRQIKKLRVLPAIETLIIKGCPYMGGGPDEAAEEEDPELRVEVLATLPRLQRLNKGLFSPEERKEAKDLMSQWLEEGEKDEDEEVIEEERGEEQSRAEDP